MANWYGAARSNYVLVKNLPALKADLEGWPISIHKKYNDDSDNSVLVCFLSDEQDSGGWPGFMDEWAEDPETGEEFSREVEFDPSTCICPHMEPGQVLVMMEVGHEKLRVLTGRAAAYNHEGKFVSVDLDDIYLKAANTFGVEYSSITPATY